ncbi:hypothetical protein TNCT_698921 [Trichonephila clavata]|uniref:Uncharacterized protein n=1 Tax=Trichonephila clavata TaxID=2740835 RepID=A0A8X6GVA7_TRICU|nr:hypothetical protein TNCT_698921 [Trichonephila clavata]
MIEENGGSFNHGLIAATSPHSDRQAKVFSHLGHPALREMRLRIASSRCQCAANRWADRIFRGRRAIGESSSIIFDEVKGRHQVVRRPLSNHVFVLEGGWPEHGSVGRAISH